MFKANVISEIASSDWPDEWPNLLDSLVSLLGSGSPDSVHGAVRVMTDFVTSDLSEDQLLPLANTILPQLLRVLGDERVRSVSSGPSTASDVSASAILGRHKIASSLGFQPVLEHIIHG